MRFHISLYRFVFALFVCAAATGVFAQATPDPHESDGDEVDSAHSAEGRITGTLEDPLGAAIADAQVTLLGSDFKPLAQAVTSKTGYFSFEKIPPGKYTLQFRAGGFRDASVSLILENKPFPPLRVTMQISVQTESVTVVSGGAAPQVTTETSENQNANTIDRDALDRVPVFDQDYITTMSRFLDDNATGTNGITLVVNGIEANGPGVTPSAIQEVKINNNPYSARFSRPGRARLDIVTKGASPAYHGSLNFMFRDSVFDASNAFATIKPPESRQYYEG